MRTKPHFEEGNNKCGPDLQHFVLKVQSTETTSGHVLLQMISSSVRPDGLQICGKMMSSLSSRRLFWRTVA